MAGKILTLILTFVACCSVATAKVLRIRCLSNEVKINIKFILGIVRTISYRIEVFNIRSDYCTQIYVQVEKLESHYEYWNSRNNISTRCDIDQSPCKPQIHFLEPLQWRINSLVSSARTARYGISEIMVSYCIMVTLSSWQMQDGAAIKNVVGIKRSNVLSWTDFHQILNLDSLIRNFLVKLFPFSTQFGRHLELQRHFAFVSLTTLQDLQLYVTSTKPYNRFYHEDPESTCFCDYKRLSNYSRRK